MKLSKSFWKTFKEKPSDAEIPSHVLMSRAGLISKSGAGIYNFLPFGLQLLKRLKGSLEIVLMKLIPWKFPCTCHSWRVVARIHRRWQGFGSEMLKFKDKVDRDLYLYTRPMKKRLLIF